MATKTITIMEDAYEILARNKKDDESFSDVIRKIAKNRRGSVEAVLECAGLWKEIPHEEIEEMHRLIENGRKNSGKRFKEIMKEI